MPETTSKTPGTPVEGEMEGSGGNRFQVLCYEQVDRLHRVMEASIPVHGRGNFPTLEVRLKDLVRVVRRSLLRNGIHLRDVRLNGGAASYVLSSVDDDQAYNDLDLIFGLTLTSEHDLRKVKDSVLNSLLDFLPDGVNKDRMSAASLNEAYVHKMVKICTDKDRWSLISLANIGGRNVELKFADTIRRQFEFSVDSFQIVLDSLMTFYEVSSSPITEHFYPTVVAESVYGDFDVALFHLNHKLIATRNPEEIRGGGLLKYCNLLVRGYAATDDSDILLLEKYMCSRFFIDFSDVAEQKVKLENYLSDHFVDDEAYLKYQYLMILWSVVNESTICLMGHERRQTLDLIHQLGQRVLMVREQRAAAYQHGQAAYQNQPFLTFDQDKSNLIIDQVYYGPFSYSYPGMDQPHHYYTVYSYDYTNPSSSSSSPSSLSPSSSSPSPSSCPYCEVCTQCVV